MGGETERERDRERGRERERGEWGRCQFIVPLICVFILLLVCALTGDRTALLEYRDDALTG